ncbi:MAG: hypothetical protein DSZ11_05450 [Sulfurovum sp.]|nr:MAG: hypothetical protein DSZ11_05450 [Sulfurovum sp.]
MGTIEPKLNDYVWENFSLIKSLFSEAVSKILLHFREIEDRKGFNDFLDGVTIVDTNLLNKLKALINKKEKDKNRKYEFNYAEGNRYRSEQKYNQALKSYQEVISLNPQDERAYHAMGMVYSELGQHKKAVESFEKAFKINPKNLKILNKLNMIMNQLNKAFFLDKKISNLNLFINKLKIQNFKQYKNFTIDFSEHINIIIGQNAIGKTTLLQAITLGLLKEDSSDANKVEYDTFVSKGEEKSELIIYHNDEEKKIKILKDKREIDKNYFIPFVLAYGSNFFTSKTNEVKEVAQSIVNETISKDFTSSIFVDYTSGFVNPIRLLEFLDLEKDEQVPKIQQTFIDTINSFLEGFKLVAHDKNYYFQKDGADTKLRLEDLSEGYRGNVLLITDMLIKILGVGYTPKTIEGIVLIDEFDKHLHPKWQSKLVNQLRDTFPKIQFIMTTHNPMSLLGRKSNEITILKDIDGEIIAEKKQGTENIDVSIVLLKYFNVKSTVSETMQEHINRFNRLKMRKELTVEEKKELKELEELLGNTVASNLIYNRPYLKFLEFIRDHKEIDFNRYEKMDDEEREKLLEEFGDLFDD